MFKALAVGLALLAGSEAIRMNHLKDGKNELNVDINPQQLTQEQQQADAFFRGKVPSLNGDVLSNGEQDGKYFKYQYVSNTAPFTITEAGADRISDGPNGEVRFKLIETIRSSSGNVQNGRITSTKKAYEVSDFSAALDNLNWD